MKLVLYSIAILFLINCSTSTSHSTKGDELKSSGSETKTELVSSQTKPASKTLMSPMESIKELDRKVDRYKTGKNLTEAETRQNKKIKQEIIRGTFDLTELSRLALDAYWEEISKKQRRHFVDLLTNLLETKAIFSKEQVAGEDKPYKISYLKEKFLDPEKTKSFVHTKINVPSNKVELTINYYLKKASDEWKIYDVVVDEASLVENYKFQFHSIIKKNGYDDLVSRMEKKLEQLKAKK